MVQAFAYVTAENAGLYRAIMRVFIQSKERFVFHLRLEEVVEGLRTSGALELPESPEPQIEYALALLCEWGNVQTCQDTTPADSIENFVKPRHTFQLTGPGEAAERALELFDAASGAKAGLESTALADLRYLIQELRQSSRDAEPDGAKIHRNLLLVRLRLEDLISTAQTLLSRLEEKNQPAKEARPLVDYAERFIGELVLASDGIGQGIRDIEASGLESLLQSSEWSSMWSRLRRWFISAPGLPSTAELLRERARTSIPALLCVIANINDQRIRRIDRSNDFRVLARWFAEAESDGDAHRLWRAAFGLSTARHLIINDETLDDHEAFDVRPNTGWLDAPPLRISMRLRDFGSDLPAVSLNRIIDRTAEKQKLAAAAHEEALRILNAQSRFGTGGRMRLSQLEHLEAGEFELFLDLLSEAVAARVYSSEPVEILSANGSLKVRLEPADDGGTASIATAEGILSGPDHWISIERVTDEVLL